MSDRYFPSVELLLGFDGSNGSTTFTDEGPDVRTVTAHGSAQLTTGNFKYGSASGLFDGSGDYLSLPASTDWGMDRTSGTFETWVYHNGPYTKVETIAIKRNTSNFNNLWVLEFTPQLAFGWWNAGGGNSNYLSAAASITMNQWVHVRICWDASYGYLFQDGLLVAKGAINTRPTSASESLYIGQDPNDSTRSWTGGLDELRFTGGICRSTTDFQVPGPYNRGRYTGVANQFSQPVINVY